MYKSCLLCKIFNNIHISVLFLHDTKFTQWNTKSKISHWIHTKIRGMPLMEWQFLDNRNLMLYNYIIYKWYWRSWWRWERITNSSLNFLFVAILDLLNSILLTRIIRNGLWLNKQIPVSACCCIKIACNSLLSSLAERSCSLPPVEARNANGIRNLFVIHSYTRNMNKWEWNGSIGRNYLLFFSHLLKSNIYVPKDFRVLMKIGY